MLQKKEITVPKFHARSCFYSHRRVENPCVSALSHPPCGGVQILGWWQNFGLFSLCMAQTGALQPSQIQGGVEGDVGGEGGGEAGSG